MFPSVNPQTASLTGTVTWSDGVTLFDGYVVLTIGMPTASSVPWPTATIGAGKYPPQRLPVRAVIPIVQGKFDPSSEVLFNSSINPPGTRYGAYWFDINKQRLFPAANVTAAPFQIAADPYPISVPSLTLPVTATTIPDAQES